MTNDPRTTDEIYEEMRSSLTGKITKLSNFTDRSFNYVWTRAFSKEIRELEVLATVSELAGWIDYTGGPVTDNDLESLGIDDTVTAEEVNQLMSDDYLDEYVKIVGINRLEGSRSTGTVTITTQSDQTTIPEGTKVTTSPDSSGETTDFLTTENAETAEGVSLVSDIPIQAVEVGDEYNVPANEITRFADPPIGVNGVDNPESTTGGEDEESNEDLRTRAKQAVQSSSQGGTVDGIKGYIRQNVEGVGTGDIIVDEFTDTVPPFVDVIVDGGLESDIISAIEFSRPAGIRHNLVRPQVIQLGFDTDLTGVDISTSTVEDTISEFLLNLGIGSEFYNSELIRQVLESDSNILDINNLGGFIERVTNESFTYVAGKDEYRLDYTYETNNGTITIEDKDGATYQEGDNFEVQDKTGDGWPETIVWIGSTPADGTEFFVDYDVTVPGETVNGDVYRTNLLRDERFEFELGSTADYDYNNTNISYELPCCSVFSDSVSIEDENGTTYTKDVDWQLAPLQDFANEDTINYVSGTTVYELSNAVLIDDIAVIDENGNIYTEGTDYTTIDTSGDGNPDSIQWDTNNSTPADGVEFTVNYNSYYKHIRWDTNNSVPAQDVTFTVTYDRSLYSTKYDVVQTTEKQITDASGDVYEQDVDFQMVDKDRDNENDAILWNEKPSTLSDQEAFYLTYVTEGNVEFGNREKADPGTINVSEV